MPPRHVFRHCLTDTDMCKKCANLHSRHSQCFMAIGIHLQMLKFNIYHHFAQVSVGGGGHWVLRRVCSPPRLILHPLRTSSVCPLLALLSACCPLVVRLLSAFKADNNRTTSSGQQGYQTPAEARFDASGSRWWCSAAGRWDALLGVARRRVVGCCARAGWGRSTWCCKTSACRRGVHGKRCGCAREYAPKALVWWQPRQCNYCGVAFLFLLYRSFFVSLPLKAPVTNSAAGASER